MLRWDLDGRFGRRSLVWDESSVFRGIQEVWAGSFSMVEEVVMNDFEDEV